MRYWISPNIEWKTFKLLNDKFKDSGPTPVNGDKILWEMLRDRQINIYIDTNQSDDPIIITTKQMPKKVKIIS